MLNDKMEDLNIKNIWKASQTEDGKSYSIEDIRSFRKQTSIQITRSTRLVILFDIGFKLLISIAFIIVMLLIHQQTSYQYIALLLLMVLVLLIGLEVTFFRRLKSIKETDSVLDNLKSKILFHKTVYQQFLLTSSFSSPLFVVAGFFIYEYVKYEQLQMGPDPVLYIFPLLAFFISYFAQRPVYKKQLQELYDSTKEIDDIAMETLRINVSKKEKQHQIIWFSVIALIGLCILLIILIN